MRSLLDQAMDKLASHSPKRPTSVRDLFTPETLIASGLGELEENVGLRGLYALVGEAGHTGVAFNSGVVNAAWAQGSKVDEILQRGPTPADGLGAIKALLEPQGKLVKALDDLIFATSADDTPDVFRGGVYAPKVFHDYLEYPSIPYSFLCGKLTRYLKDGSGGGKHIVASIAKKVDAMIAGLTDTSTTAIMPAEGSTMTLGEFLDQNGFGSVGLNALSYRLAHVKSVAQSLPTSFTGVIAGVVEKIAESCSEANLSSLLTPSKGLEADMERLESGLPAIKKALNDLAGAYRIIDMMAEWHSGEAEGDAMRQLVESLTPAEGELPAEGLGYGTALSVFLAKSYMTEQGNNPGTKIVKVIANKIRDLRAHHASGNSEQ